VVGNTTLADTVRHRQPSMKKGPLWPHGLLQQSSLSIMEQRCINNRFKFSSLPNCELKGTVARDF
jgi:hypothetical protein